MTIRGLAFPFNKDATSFPAKTQDDDTIADNIRRILLTPRGSRVMRPSSGSDVLSFVFENVGDVLRARVEHEVRRSLADGEPRARVLAVNVQERESAAGGKEVFVEVVYEANAEVKKTSVTLP